MFKNNLNLIMNTKIKNINQTLMNIINIINISYKKLNFIIKIKTLNITRMNDNITMMNRHNHMITVYQQMTFKLNCGHCQIQMTKSIIKILDKIFLHASIMLRETHELHEISKDERGKNKMVGGRRTHKNGK